LTRALLTAAQSAFTGYEKMEYNSVTMICQSTLKTVPAPLLVIIGYGAFGVILGSTAAFLTTYITAAPLIGGVNKTDINNLREILKELGPLSHLLKLPLNIIEKLTLNA